MESKHCCVCGDPIDGTPFYHGGRVFCKTHHERVNSDSKGLWTSNLFSIGGMMLLVLVAFGLEKLLADALGKTGLVLVSALIALVPPILWLTIFYRQDRLEPEPKAHILKMLVLGALVQQAIYIPLVTFLLPSNLLGAQASFVKTLLLFALIAGFQEVLKLLTIRYGIFASSEFDEKIDGIVYGSAVGLGFALMFNFQYILSAGGPLLSAGAANAVVASLAHASFGGLTGYFLAVTKFEKKPWWWLPSALLLAILGNTLTAWLLENITRRGFRVNYMLGLIPAAFVAILVFGLLMVIIKRNIADELTDSFDQEGVHETPLGIKRQIRAEGLFIWTMACVVLVGAIVFGAVVNQLQRQQLSEHVTISYPAAWSGNVQQDGSFVASELMIPGQLPTRLLVSSTPLITPIEQTDSVEVRLGNAAASWTMKSASLYTYYVPIDTTFRMVDGKPAAVISYMFIKDTSATGDARLAYGMGYDVLFFTDSEQICVTLSAGKDAEVSLEELLHRILNAVRLS